jgi:hypothetical protein
MGRYKILNKVVLLFVVLISSHMHANSVHMKNDSPYQLRAVVRGNDGSYLGEMIIMSQETGTWSDNSYGAVPFDEWGPVDHTTTPYTVLWYCMNGDSYSVNTLVPTGALVTAQFGEGDRICKSKKGKKSTEEAPPGGYLDQGYEPEAHPH